MKFRYHLLSLVLIATSWGSSVRLEAQETSRTMEEVVVTSRRQDESQQDVPISVTVIGSERIDQIKPVTLRDFDTLAPNVYIGMNTAGPGAAALYIRGIGYADIEKTQSPQVGVIVDGIQMGSSTGQLIDAFDIESVEINRGPQGIFFGKNTIGGNIVVNRVKPQFNEMGFTGSVELGNFDSQIYKARGNIALLDDTLALKLGAIKREREGYYDNLTLNQTAGDVDYQAYTAALRWNLGDRLDLIATFDNIDDSSQIPPQDPRYDGSNPHINRADKEEPTIYDVDQFSLNLTWNINDNLSLYSITGWHDGMDSVNQDFDGGSIDGQALPFAQLHTLREQQLEVQSQELRLHGSINDDVDYMAGLYYYESELGFTQRTSQVVQARVPVVASCPPGFNRNAVNMLCQLGPIQSTQVASEDVTSSAIFGSITFRPMDTLELLFGLRYIDEKKEATNSYFNNTLPRPGVTPTRANEFDFSNFLSIPGIPFSAEDDWSETIFSTSINWSYTDFSRIYLNYSEGFRSGGFSIRGARVRTDTLVCTQADSAACVADSTPPMAGVAPPLTLARVTRDENPSFLPETASQVEVGFKHEFLEGRLHFNLAWYRLTLENGQFSAVIAFPPPSAGVTPNIPGTTTFINNAGDSVYDGLEIEGRWLINDNFSAIFNYGTTDANNKLFTIPCDRLDTCGFLAPTANPDTPGTLRTRGGNSDSRHPDNTWSLNLAYQKDLSMGTLYANIGYKHTGEFLLVNTGAGNDARTFGGDYNLIDARIAWDMPLRDDSIISFSLYGKNLKDEEYREQALFLGGSSEILPTGGPNTGFQGWGAPRTYALEVRYSM